MVWYVLASTDQGIRIGERLEFVAQGEALGQRLGKAVGPGPDRKERFRAGHLPGRRQARDPAFHQRRVKTSYTGHLACPIDTGAAGLLEPIYLERSIDHCAAEGMG
jgi:hypothetical protein